MIRNTICAFLVSLCLFPSVFADIGSGPAPLPKPPLVAPLTVEQHSGKDPQYRISLPKSVLLELLNEPRTSTASESWMGMGIVAVVSLTAAAIAVLFVPKGHSNRKPVAIVLIVGCVSVGITILINRLGVNSAEPQSKNEDALISFEVREDGHDVILSIPRGAAAITGPADSQ